MNPLSSRMLCQISTGSFHYQPLKKRFFLDINTHLSFFYNPQHSICLYYSMTENYSSPCGGSQAQLALQFIPRQQRLAVVLYKVKLSVSRFGRDININGHYDLYLGKDFAREQKALSENRISMWRVHNNQKMPHGYKSGGS